MNDYQLLDSGDLSKLEKFGPYIIERPSPVALWPKQNPSLWKKKHANFSREENKGWKFYEKIPSSWTIEMASLTFKLACTDFGHLGLFPEHAAFWDLPLPKDRQIRVLNLFAYTGGATLSFARHPNVEVCHVDASKKSVAWAKENAALSGLEKAKTRWIIDDVRKFLEREIKRGSFYDIVILDPPSFGRGAQFELFQIEQDINPLLELCKKVLSPNPLFVIFTSHTPGFTPIVMKQLLEAHFGEGAEGGEMKIPSSTSFLLPAGSFGLWTAR
jgi:23S rRNA (cytosine1962-C5)-methyltransferase